MSREYLKISHVTIIQAMQRDELQWVKEPNCLYSYTLGIGCTCTDILHLSHWSKHWDINIFNYVLVENKEFSPHSGNDFYMAYRHTENHWHMNFLSSDKIIWILAESCVLYFIVIISRIITAQQIQYNEINNG